MKKLICLLVCISLLAAVLPAFAVSAAQGDVFQTLYNVDFENGTVGANPPKGTINCVIRTFAENVDKGCYVRIGEETGRLVQENRRYTLGRQSDLVTSYFCNGNRMFYEWVTVASRMLLKSL